MHYDTVSITVDYHCNKSCSFEFSNQRRLPHYDVTPTSCCHKSRSSQKGDVQWTCMLITVAVEWVWTISSQLHGAPLHNPGHEILAFWWILWFITVFKWASHRSLFSVSFFQSNISHRINLKDLFRVFIKSNVCRCGYRAMQFQASIPEFDS
jgi:hypothetical protein